MSVLPVALFLSLLNARHLTPVDAAHEYSVTPDEDEGWVRAVPAPRASDMVAVQGDILRLREETGQLAARVTSLDKTLGQYDTVVGSGDTDPERNAKEFQVIQEKRDECRQLLDAKQCELSALQRREEELLASGEPTLVFAGAIVGVVPIYEGRNGQPEDFPGLTWEAAWPLIAMRLGLSDMSRPESLGALSDALDQLTKTPAENGEDKGKKADNESANAATVDIGPEAQPKAKAKRGEVAE